MEKPVIIGVAAAATATVAVLGYYYVYQTSFKATSSDATQAQKEDSLEVTLILLKSLMRDPTKDLAHRATTVSWSLYTELFNQGKDALLYEWRSQGSRRRIYQVEDAEVLTDLVPVVERQGYSVVTTKKICPCRECCEDELYSALAIEPTKASEVGKLLTADMKLIAIVDPTLSKSELNHNK